MDSFSYQKGENCLRNFLLYYALAWEPIAAQVTKSYSCRLPALERFYRETKFTQVRISKPS